MEYIICGVILICLLAIYDISRYWLKLKYTDKREIDSVIKDIEALKADLSKFNVGRMDEIRTEINHLKMKLLR